MTDKEIFVIWKGTDSLNSRFTLEKALEESGSQFKKTSSFFSMFSPVFIHPETGVEIGYEASTDICLRAPTKESASRVYYAIQKSMSRHFPGAKETTYELPTKPIQPTKPTRPEVPRAA